MTWGLGLRIAGHSLAAYLPRSTGLEIVLGAVVLSGVLELIGIGLYIGLMRRTIGGVPGEQLRPALQPILPYMQSMMLGWVLYAGLNLALLTAMAWQRQIAAPALWNDFAVRCFVGLVLLPVTFAFSMRFLPLYLRLAAPAWPVHRVAYVYLLGWGVEVIALMPPVQTLMPQGSEILMQAGRMFKGMGILWFVWRLGVFARGYLAWLAPASSRRSRPPRQTKGAGETFGAFEGLIVSAYIWLVVAVGCELWSSLMGLTGWGASISHDAIRHLYLMGFVTLLILGVGVRMLPGLMHVRRVANPGLVSVTLWLGNAAVVGRVVLVGLPGSMWQGLPLWAVQGARMAFAWSGILGLAAVCFLALNLWQTAKMAPAEPASAPAPAPE
ncbi:MAG: hypothetical protein ETSY2_34690 [Candidatus Entotheonella gemina]|uniref:NnrS family protein n=2 Tax=Candidatus Entotheonella TaxID=93171 RepID=W4LY47_9BACT|nr:MAG: hypothetical protein ETSY2_34690 [Candidatus Entotheonella gemina]